MSQCISLNDRERLMLEPGDVVEVRQDDGTLKEFKVKYSPWQVGHGTWVIGLVGVAGGYSLARVERLTHFNPNFTGKHHRFFSGPATNVKSKVAELAKCIAEKGGAS